MKEKNNKTKMNATQSPEANSIERDAVVQQEYGTSANPIAKMHCKSLCFRRETDLTFQVKCALKRKCSDN